LQGLAEDAEELRAWVIDMKLRLLQANEMRSVIGSDRYVGGMIDMGSGHLHPLNLALGEASRRRSNLGVRLFEQSEVTCASTTALKSKVHSAQGSGARQDAWCWAATLTSMASTLT
jgi:gamma-glutamylputrescine oxidase